MTPRRNRPSLPTLSLASLVALAAPPAPDVAWKATDHKAIAEDVAAYWDARDEKKGISDALEKLEKSLQRIEKKYAAQPLLTCVEDWEAVFCAASLLGSAKQANDANKKAKLGKVYEETLESDDRSSSLALSFPKSYKATGPPLPLVLLIPDAGKKPKVHLDESWTDAAGRENAILAAVEMPADPACWGKMELSEPSGVSAVMTAFGLMTKYYAVDLDRVFLAGTGPGITAALATAASYPHCFAGVVGRGDAPEWSPVTNFSIVPTLFVSGGTFATAFAEARKAAGNENCTVLNGGTEADIWAWMAARPREAYPSALEFVPYTPYGAVCSWIMTAGFEVGQGPKVTAKADRAANTITVTAENVVSVHLLLNDRLADLGKVVKVVINGETRELLPERNRRSMIDRCFDWGDWGRVFTVTQSFDVK
ncbi:MAG: hypothetical protein AB1726_06770 [Planctomycetota bacterium]